MELLDDVLVYPPLDAVHLFLPAYKIARVMWSDQFNIRAYYTAWVSRVKKMYAPDFQLIREEGNTISYEEGLFWAGAFFGRGRRTAVRPYGITYAFYRVVNMLNCGPVANTPGSYYYFVTRHMSPTK